MFAALFGYGLVQLANRQLATGRGRPQVCTVLRRRSRPTSANQQILTTDVHRGRGTRPEPGHADPGSRTDGRGTATSTHARSGGVPIGNTWPV